MITVLVKGFFFLIPLFAAAAAAVVALLVVLLVLETTIFFEAEEPESLSLMCFSQTGLTTSGLGFCLDGHLLIDM